MNATWVYAALGILFWSIVLSAQTSTTTVLSAVTPSPAVYGSSVSLSAQVTPVGASGSVTFMDGVTMLGFGSINGSGIAQLSTKTLPAGSHSLRAVFGGDTNGFQPSKSSVIPYLVTVVPGGAFSSATN